MGSIAAILTSAGRIAGLSIQAIAYIEQAVAMIERFMPLAEKEVDLFKTFVWPAWTTVFALFKDKRIPTADEWELLDRGADAMHARLQAA